GGLAVLEDHDEIVLLIQSRNGFIYSGRLSSPYDDSVDITALGNSKGTNRDWDIEALQYRGSYTVISANFTDGPIGGVYHLIFPEKAGVSLVQSHSATEMVSYSSPGTFKITLAATSDSGLRSRVTRIVNVRETSAPEFEVQYAANYCVNEPVSFSIVSDATLTAYVWDIEGASGSIYEPAPEYAFTSAGTFGFQVEVTAPDGCTNAVRSTVTILPPPTASLSLPSTPLCTNSALALSATTPDIYEGHLAYEWLVDGLPAGTERDLEFVFTETGMHDITLKTSIPGCMDEVTVTTPEIFAGP